LGSRFDDLGAGAKALRNIVERSSGEAAAEPERGDDQRGMTVPEHRCNHWRVVLKIVQQAERCGYM
jgi:hypothetical protein